MHKQVKREQNRALRRVNIKDEYTQNGCQSYSRQLHIPVRFSYGASTNMLTLAKGLTATCVDVGDKANSYVKVGVDLYLSHTIFRRLRVSPS